MARISDFKSSLIGGGARPNAFYVQLTFPNYVGLGAVAGQQAQFLCRSASLPPSTIEQITTMYRGRPVNFAGERTFQPWNVSVYADTSFNIRNALESWQNGIQNYDSSLGRTNPTEYQVDLQVHQLDRSGAIIKSYTFVDSMPISIGPMALDYDNSNQISQFDVEFSYNYFTSNTTTGDGSNVNVSVDTPIGTFPITG